MKPGQNIVAEIRRCREHGTDLLLQTYRSKLLTEAQRLCGGAVEAEDLMFATVEAAVLHIDSYRGEGDFFDWMHGILLNLHHNSMRRKSAKSVVFADELPEMTEESAREDVDRLIDAIDGRIVKAVVEKLPKEQKEVIVLHYFMDLSIPQIARFLVLPVGTVKSRLHYARRALAERLKGDGRRVAVGASLVMMLGLALAAWVGSSTNDEPPAGIVCSTHDQHGDAEVLSLGLKTPPPMDAASASEATWRFRVSTNGTQNVVSESLLKQQKEQEKMTAGSKARLGVLATSLPLMMLAADSSVQGASRCDSAPIAFNSCPGGGGETGIGAFLSRYRTPADSPCLPRFNSREPKGLFFIVY